MGFELNEVKQHQYIGYRFYPKERGDEHHDTIEFFMLLYLCYGCDEGSQAAKQRNHKSRYTLSPVEYQNCPAMP